MTDERLDRDGIRHFWLRSEEASASLRAQGDSTARFYVGAVSAATAWFAVNASDRSLAITLIVALGVIGSGHATWYQMRALRFHRRAMFLASRFADLSGLTGADRLYIDDEKGSVWRSGHPLTGALFSGLAVLAATAVYSIVLGLAPAGK
ncbi:MAG: hypothetical protein M3Z10_03950 [Gemmatimonadota bacterium]|nr:hypothetical protein [Gemmatimonadota bacterium]